MLWLDQAALATCLRALNAMDLPAGPEAEWAPQPQGLTQTEEMLLFQEMLATYPYRSEISVREGDECRVQVFNDEWIPVLTHEILVRLVNKTTVNVFRAAFPGGALENKEMHMDDFLFYLQWCLLIDFNGDILRDDEYARLKWVRDWCKDDGRLVFYTCVKRDTALPARTIHFCIRNTCTEWIDHFWMTIPTAIDNMHIMLVDTSNNNAIMQVMVTRSDMLSYLQTAANYSCEPQARGAGFGEDPKRNPPSGRVTR